MHPAPGGLAGETQDKEAQVEVDRLAAAPRKTLNRNPAGKIACSQSSQGKQPSPGLWFEHLFTANLEMVIVESQKRFECKLGLPSTAEDWPKPQAMNLGAVRGSPAATRF